MDSTPLSVAQFVKINPSIESISRDVSFESECSVEKGAKEHTSKNNSLLSKLYGA